MKKKALLLTLSAAALVAASAFGTMAYLTDKDTAVNTFTVGHVDITLDEAKVNEDGTPVEGADRVKENKYHLLPGHEYIKDPTVTVESGSEESYVRMLMTINKQDELDKIFDEINDLRAKKDPAQDPISIAEVLTGWNNEWELVKETENNDNTRTYEFRYKTTVDGDDGTLKPLFTKIEMPGEITNEQLATLYTEGAKGNLEIKVVAHAIQADGFDTAEDAWEMFDPNLPGYDFDK